MFWSWTWITFTRAKAVVFFTRGPTVDVILALDLFARGVTVAVDYIFTGRMTLTIVGWSATVNAVRSWGGVLMVGVSRRGHRHILESQVRWAKSRRRQNPVRRSQVRGSDNPHKYECKNERLFQ
jgi:hypothetical protein